jgi:D-arabinose 1-dehydrogenase-like Zn-dependent alcohol dehydrogenase
MQGILDTSLFPGFEVSGIVDEICPTVTDCSVVVGDRVIVYPADEEECTETGYAEYMVVKDAANLIKVPDSLALDVAAILPCGALAAYAAVQRVRPFVEDRLQNTDEIINVLIVGAGGLGLWTLRIAEHYLGTNQSRIRLTVADTSIDKLLIAKEHGCYDVVHWNEALHEEYIEMRIKNVCKGGVDAVIDFASSARTIHRAVKVLKEGGVIVVGGNSKYEVPLDLHQLAMRGQSILGVHRGSRSQLSELVQLVARQEIIPPMYTVFPVEEANMVFQQLSHSQLNGRAVFQVCSANESSVFVSPSQDQLRSANASSEFGRGESANEEPMYINSPEPVSRLTNGSAFFLPQ